MKLSTQSRKRITRFIVAASFLLGSGVAARPLFCQQPPPQATGDKNSADAANQQKAHEVLDQMVHALGGDAWLNLVTTEQQGSSAGFYHGNPNGGYSIFWSLHQYPDKDRVEYGKKRDVVQIYNGAESWELTYRGKAHLPAEQTTDLIRRRDHSLDVVIREWLHQPGIALFYEGQVMVERHLADQVSIVTASNDAVTLQIDATDHLPRRRSWLWRDPLYKDKNEDAETYDDYHLVQGIPTPFMVTRYHNGDMVNQRFLTRVAYNVPVLPDAFNADATAAHIKK